MAVITVAVMTLGLIGATGLSVNGKPQPPPPTCTGHTCNSIKSGVGDVSDCTTNHLDPQVQSSTDGGATWQQAFIVPPNMDAPQFTYDVLNGTHYVSVSCDRSAPEMAHFLFRTTFVLPATAINRCISVQVHADNAAALFLNGNPFGAQMDIEDPVNFKDPAQVYSDNNQAHFLNGVNTLSFDVHNFTSQTALDFDAAICYDEGCSDTQPPAISCNVTQDTLWPPNHDLETVGLTATVTDDCDSHVVIGGGPNGTGVTVYSDEPDLDILGSGNFSPDAKNIALNTLRLRSERSGNEDGRVYLIVVQATDKAGHTGYCAKTVTVTHAQSKAAKQSVAAQAAAAQAYFNTNHTPPPGYVQVGTGPIVGPKQ